MERETAPVRRGRKPPVGDAVIDRAFALLGSFDATHRAQSLADLTRRAGMPRSTTLRLARKLVDCGAMERREDGNYVVGLRLLEIASLAPRGHGLRAVAMPFMEDLFHVTRQHVLLAVLDGAEALLVERLSAHDAKPVHYRIGGRMPLHATGVGLVLLAGADHSLQERVLNSFVDAAADEGPRTPADLRRVLAEVRRGGFATATRSRRTSVAAPVYDGNDKVVASLSVVIPTGDADPMALVPAVRASARAVSRELRGSPM